MRHYYFRIVLQNRDPGGVNSFTEIRMMTYIYISARAA